MTTIITLALKDIKLLLRDRFGLFWVVAFPLIMALFFGSIFSSGGSGSRNLKIAYVGDTSSESSESFFKELSTSEAMSIRRTTLDSARTLVSTGKLTAYVHYEDTSSQAYSIFSSTQPSIEIGVDPSRKAESAFLRGMITQAYFKRLKNSMSDPAQMHASIQEHRAAIDSAPGLTPDQRSYLKGFLGNLDDFLATTETSDSTNHSGTKDTESFSPFKEPDIETVEVTVSSKFPRTSWEITFPQALQWALIGCAAAFGLSIVTERTGGTYLRLRLAPITRAQILIGKGLACFTACVSISVLLLSIGIFVFGVRVVNPAGLAMAIVCAAICFVGIMMLISVLGKTEQAVGGAGWAILLVMSMTGGGMVPLFAMPSWMLTIGHISPVKWSVMALEGAIWRGFGVAEMMLPLGILVGVGVLGLSIGVAILTRWDS